MPICALHNNGFTVFIEVATVIIRVMKVTIVSVSDAVYIKIIMNLNTLLDGKDKLFD